MTDLPTFTQPFKGQGGSGTYLQWTHKCTNGVWTDTLPLDHLDGWHLERAEPLTISPSLLCPICKTHGFITDGKWVTA